MGKKHEKSKLPRSVKALSQSRKDWAKKNGLDYKDDDDNKDLAKKEFIETFVEGLDRAMEIILDKPNSDLAKDVKREIEVALGRTKKIAAATKYYSEHRKKYQYIKYLPNVIVSTLKYVQSPSADLTAQEATLAKNLDEVVLHDFCKAILKKPCEHYEAIGLSNSAAMALASLVPSARILEKGYWYRALIATLYSMAETDHFEIDDVFEAITTVDKNKVLRKRDLKRKFWLEFILMKNSNRFKDLNESQKTLHEHLQIKALEYMDTLSEDELEAMLLKYIKRRRESESTNSDGRRIFRFVDHANSNSPYTKIKKVVEKIIKGKSEYEAYLK